MNIKFEYLYRDAANYKQFGEIIFSNRTGLAIEAIDEHIRKHLVAHEWFYPKQWGLKPLHYFMWDEELDHLLHEYESITITEEAHNSVDIQEFLQTIASQVITAQ